MSYHYNQRSRSRMTSNTIFLTMANTSSSSSSSSQLTVEFDFLFKSENIFVRRVLHPLAESVTRFSNPNRRASASVAVRGEPPSSLDDIMATAVSGAVASCPLPESDRRGLVDLAFGEASRIRTTTPPEHGYVLRLGFEIRTTHYHRYVREVRSDGGAPVAESSALEEVEVREGEEEKGCCICLEELIGGASRMPCLHVFHGGCIRKWLRNRRCCPLCRYQLPTTTSRQGRTYVPASAGG